MKLRTLPINDVHPHFHGLLMAACTQLCLIDVDHGSINRCIASNCEPVAMMKKIRLRVDLILHY